MSAIISLSLLGILTLFLGFLKSRKVLLPATLLFLVAAFVLNLRDWNEHYLFFNLMLRSNNLFISFSGIVLVTAFLVVALSRHFNADDDPAAHPAEYYAILLFSTVGAMMMIGYENLIMLFIGVEILSVAMYVLTGTDKRNIRSNEAALKYFLMGAFATGILLFGIALIYGATGTFNISGIGGYVYGAAQAGQVSPMLYVGLVLLLVGMLFKVSAAPFHFWTPDVYEGAPTIFTTFMSTVVKTAGFAAIYKLLAGSFGGVFPFWWQTLTVITLLTLLVGNVTAVYQHSFKRMMAYSSISHAGYLLLAVTAKTGGTQDAILFYSLAYSLATVSAFGVLMLVAERRQVEGRADESYDAFNGLARQSPFLAFVLAVSMFSLAGIPLTAGFWGKFFVFATAVERGMTSLLIIAILMSAVGIYYYFRVLIAAYLKPAEPDLRPLAISPLYRTVLILTTALTLLLGLAPDLIKSVF
jgi:NADH-quinone oxidoreductase subunit N